MSKRELVEVELTDIDPNPFRSPSAKYNPNKVDVLKASIADVGLWESLIARPKGNRWEIPFHHHTLEAARQVGIKTVSLIKRDLDDEQMIGMWGRENLEDYNADCSSLLETWEGGIKFLSVRARTEPQPIENARLLGWTELHSQRDVAQLTYTARACHGASQLIAGGHMQVTDLDGLSVSAALALVERVLNRIEMLDKLGKKGGRPAKEIESDKKIVANAGRTVARDYREGNVAHKDIRTEIDYRAVKTATKKDKVSPLFAHYAKQVAESIHKMLVDDKVAERLAEVERALPLVTLEEDERALRRMDFALAEHEDTTGKWRKRLAAKGAKVIPFALLMKEDK